MSGGAGAGSGSVSSEDVARFLREAEGKYEARLGDLRERMRALEKERNDAEEEWSRNLAERSREVERLRRLAGEKDGEYDESVRGMREREKKIAELEGVNAALKQESDTVRAQVVKLQDALDARKDVEVRCTCLPSHTQLTSMPKSSLTQEMAELQSRIDSMAEQADELRSKESQMRATNKVRVSGFGGACMFTSDCRRCETSCAKSNSPLRFSNASVTLVLGIGAGRRQPTETAQNPQSRSAHRRAAR